MDFDGRARIGYEIRFAPLVNDPRRGMLDALADKRNYVLVSAELPGYLFSIEKLISRAMAVNL